METEINGHFVSLEKLIDAQAVVDKINKGRAEAREKAHIRALCRMAAEQWIVDNPILSRMSYRTA